MNLSTIQSVDALHALCGRAFYSAVNEHHFVTTQDHVLIPLNDIVRTFYRITDPMAQPITMVQELFEKVIELQHQAERKERSFSLGRRIVLFFSNIWFNRDKIIHKIFLRIHPKLSPGVIASWLIQRNLSPYKDLETYQFVEKFKESKSLSFTQARASLFATDYKTLLKKLDAILEASHELALIYRERKDRSPSVPTFGGLILALTGLSERTLILCKNKEERAHFFAATRRENKSPNEVVHEIFKKTMYRGAQKERLLQSLHQIIPEDFSPREHEDVFYEMAQQDTRSAYINPFLHAIDAAIHDNCKIKELYTTASSALSELEKAACILQAQPLKLANSILQSEFHKFRVKIIFQILHNIIENRLSSFQDSTILKQKVCLESPINDHYLYEEAVLFLEQGTQRVSEKKQAQLKKMIQDLEAFKDFDAFLLGKANIVIRSLEDAIKTKEMKDSLDKDSIELSKHYDDLPFVIKTVMRRHLTPFMKYGSYDEETEALLSYLKKPNYAAHNVMDFPKNLVQHFIHGDQDRKLALLDVVQELQSPPASFALYYQMSMGHLERAVNNE